MEAHERHGRERRVLRTLSAERLPAGFPAPAEGRRPHQAAHRQRGFLHVFLAEVRGRQHPRGGQRREGCGSRGRGPHDDCGFRDLRCGPDGAGIREGLRVPGNGRGYHRFFLPVAGPWGKAEPAPLSQTELFQKDEADERDDDHGREYEDDEDAFRPHARHASSRHACLPFREYGNDGHEVRAFP